MRVIAPAEFRATGRSAVKPTLFFDPIARKKLNPSKQQAAFPASAPHIPRESGDPFTNLLTLLVVCGLVWGLILGLCHWLHI